ncbi:DNA polymerase III subunit beta [Candidatus Parcubacteria bacterium]|nr:MAG: DNA polymerase III subunit beta [Candidatus Parcubacteria bacterium]
MKFISVRANLKDGLLSIERAEGDAAGLPILRNVLVEAEEGGIKLTATNLEIAATYSLSGKVIEPGRATVSLDTLSGIIGNIQSDRLNLEKRGDGLEVRSDNYRAALQGLPTDDFPIIPKVQNTDEHISLEAETFREALSQVVVATQPSDLRPELNSILFDFSLDELVVAATDSFRLAEKKVPSAEIMATYTRAFRILVPLRTAHELLRSLKDEGRVEFSHDDNQILFRGGQLELVSRLVEGNFPDYHAIVPKKFSAEAVLNRQEFANALKLASVFAGKTSEVKLSVATNGRALEVSSADQTVGENQSVLPAKISGRTGEVIFNWKYLLDAVKSVKSEEVFLGINENSDPTLIRSPKDGSYFYILKPILKG